MASFKLHRLEGKVAVITGAAGGIGESAARLFAKHGAKIVAADINYDLGEKLCQELGGPKHASFVHCDVTKESDVETTVNTAVSTYGKLDIMFNNAGTVDPFGPILNTTTEDFLNVLKVNLLGPFLGTKHAARVMIPAKSGSIITTSSVAGVVGGMSTHAYTSSKHGVIGLTRNAAVELGRHGIRVNCVSPYVVLTPLAKRVLGIDETTVGDVIYSSLKGKAVLMPEDVAEAALYLAGDESKYVSGTNLVVDGGMTVHNVGFPMPGLD